MCNSYEECCSSFDNCYDAYGGRQDDIIFITRDMKMKERSEECPRGDAREYVCDRMQMALDSLDKVVESALWVVRKGNEITTPFPYMGSKITPRVDTAFHSAATTALFYKQLNGLCDCGYTKLCPPESDDCKVDQVVDIFSKHSCIPGDAESCIDKYMRDEFLKEYLKSI